MSSSCLASGARKTVWREFILSHWNKSPGSFSTAPDGPVFDSEEVFEAFRTAMAAYAVGREARVRTYIGGRLVQGWPDDVFMKVTPERSFLDYVEAIERTIQGESFAIIINDFAVHSPALWARVRDLAEEVTAVVGLPSDYLHCGLFCGTYPMTPFGIHCDDSGGFMFGVEGKKKMFLWPEDYFEGRTVKTQLGKIVEDPRQFLDDALVLDIEPGLMSYWPTTYWHVGYSEHRNFHAAITLGFWDRRSLSRRVAENVEKTVRDRLREKDICTQSWPKATPLPAEMRSLVQLVQELAQDGSIRNEIEDAWLRQFSACGFRAVPDRLPAVSIAPTASVQLNRPVFVRCVENSAVVYAGGHSFAGSTRTTVSLVERLRETQEIPVFKLLGEIGVSNDDVDLDRAEVMKLLSHLAAVRALTVINPPTAKSDVLQTDAADL